MAEVLDNSGNRISAVVRSSKLAKQSKVLVAELEALRTRCAGLEARIEDLESSDSQAAADNFDFGARLAALETMMTQGWVRTHDDSAGWQRVRTLDDSAGWQGQ